MFRYKTTFYAVGDDDQQYTVLVYEIAVPYTGLALQTLEGDDVTRLRQGRYKITETGVVLTSGSPNAP
jgi:hypothetical protein